MVNNPIYIKTASRTGKTIQLSHENITKNCCTFPESIDNVCYPRSRFQEVLDVPMTRAYFFNDQSFLTLARHKLRLLLVGRKHSVYKPNVSFS